LKGYTSTEFAIIPVNPNPEFGTPIEFGVIITSFG
jgi:hypothetical protein